MSLSPRSVPLCCLAEAWILPPGWFCYIESQAREAQGLSLIAEQNSLQPVNGFP